MKKFLILILLFTSQSIFAQNIVINEIMASNDITLFDEDGDASDWIEIFNTSSSAIDLEGYYLSDDTLEMDKWQFGSVVIDPGEHLIVFASDKDTIKTFWHTNFKISASGESIILSDSTGLVVDHIILPSSLTDVSYARIYDADSVWVLQGPTPGSANSGIEYEMSDTISVSHEGGFYSSSISVELSTMDSRIYYTLDGTDPTEASVEYSAPINISKTSVLKAASYKSGLLPGPTIHRTYLINEGTNLPVISLSTDPTNLFDPDSGIYVHYEEDWERPAHVEFFDDDKNLGFSENIGINIYGGYTKRYAQKSLAVKFKSEYGNNKLEYDLFPGFKLKTFKSFILRNSGNDFEQTHIRDAFMQTLIKDLDIEYLEYRPAVTFINGEYWGIYNIREKINEHYIANRHGVDPDNIDMMEGYSAYNDDLNDPDGEYGLWVGNLEAIHGDTLHYKQLIDYLDTEDLTTEAAYNFIDSMIDIDECLLYYAAHVYYNSQDWPSNNSKYWREKNPEGKWRWILYDLDFGFNLYEWSSEGNSEDHVDYLFSGDPSQRPWSKPVESTFIPRKIVENPKIKNQFVNQVADLLNSNFKPDRVLSIMNSIADHIADDIGRHRTRWGINGDNLDRLISFAQNRPVNLRGHVRNFFNSGVDGVITINSSEGGSIKVNSLHFETDELPWSGRYFQDNEIHVTAIPDPGYKFEKWSGDNNSSYPSIGIYAIRSTSLTASFSIDTNVAKEIVINEINYNSSDQFETGDWVELYNKSDSTIDLSNWIFSDSDPSHQFKIPENTLLASDKYLVIVQDDSAFSNRFPEIQNYIGEMNFGLNGAGEFMQLIDTNGVIIDSLTYDDTDPWPTEPDGNGPTLELRDASLDNSLAENWVASYEYGSPGKINTTLISVEDFQGGKLPTDYKLEQNYPNPFNPTTIIEYQVPMKGLVSLKVYDTLGREVAILFEGVRQVGSYTITFDGSRLSSGVYFYKLQSDKSIIVKKLVLLK